MLRTIGCNEGVFGEAVEMVSRWLSENADKYIAHDSEEVLILGINRENMMVITTYCQIFIKDVSNQFMIDPKHFNIPAMEIPKFLIDIIRAGFNVEAFIANPHRYYIENVLINLFAVQIARRDPRSMPYIRRIATHPEFGITHFDGSDMMFLEMRQIYEINGSWFLPILYSLYCDIIVYTSNGTINPTIAQIEETPHYLLRPSFGSGTGNYYYDEPADLIERKTDEYIIMSNAGVSLSNMANIYSISDVGISENHRIMERETLIMNLYLPPEILYLWACSSYYNDEINPIIVYYRYCILPFVLMIRNGDIPKAGLEEKLRKIYNNNERMIRMAEDDSQSMELVGILKMINGAMD